MADTSRSDQIIRKASEDANRAIDRRVLRELTREAAADRRQAKWDDFLGPQGEAEEALPAPQRRRENE